MKKNNTLIVFSIGDNAISINDIIQYQSIERICMVISNLVNSGFKVVLVTAGAILMGMKQRGLKQYPDNVSVKQALSSLGQIELMRTYQKIFHEFNQKIAQVLLTREIMASHTRVKNAKNTLHKLLSLNYIPVINENDTVSVQDIELKDNFPLASTVAKFLNAQWIVVRKEATSQYMSIQRNSAQVTHCGSDEELYQGFNLSKVFEANPKLKAFPATLEK